jgi:flagella basal body P-ring formation protein FlgA
MLRVSILLGVVLTFLYGIASAKDTVRIYLKDSAEVTGVEFKLGDISRIETSDEHLRHELSNAVIGRPPLVGYRGKFGRAAVQSRVVHLFPQLGSKVYWHGSDAVEVRALGFRLSKKQYIHEAKNYLRQKLEDKYDQIQIEVDGLYKDINLPKGKLLINYQIKNRQSVRKRMQVWADIFIDNQKVMSHPVWFKVRAYGQAWVSKYDQSAGAAIRGNMFTRQYVDIAKIGRNVISELPECCYMRLRKKMYIGDVLVQENAEEIPAIARGSKVHVIATTESVQIATKVTSLQDGDIGDIVKLQKGRDGLVYNAKVIGRNMLTVDGVKK